MSKKLNDFMLDYQQAMIDVNKIKTSPFQVRKFSDEDKKKELAQSILTDGLIQHIVVCLNNGHFETIAGGRRVEAIRKYTDIKEIPARIVNVDDLQARRISVAENLVRENLSSIETIEEIVEIVDAELMEDKEYASMGKNPTKMVKTLFRIEGRP